MHSDCQISIVMPLYNNVDYVEIAIDSIQNQCLMNWKCIIVDDDSIDGSFDLVNNLIVEDERFLLIKRHDVTNINGANVCRNIGINLVHTPFVMFMDADDYLYDKCLSLRMEAVQQNIGYDFYVFKTAFVNNDGLVTGHFYNPNSNIQNIIVQLVNHKIPWHTMSPVWNVQFLKSIAGWNEDYERLQDVELNIRALLRDPLIYFANNSVDSFYRYNGMTPEKSKKARMGFCRLVKDYHDKLQNSALLSQDDKDQIHIVFQKTIENQLITYLLKQQENNEYKDVQWEELYIKTLKVLQVEEFHEVEKIFGLNS